MTTPMMLDGAGAPSRWANEAVDALPYADVLPEGWRADVDRMINEEMRRMSKRPKDYLAEMAPAREIDWSRCPLLEKEFKRVAEGKGSMPPPDEARYELDPPPLNKRDDENAWEVAVKNARAQLEHQALRIQNLELAAKFGAWKPPRQPSFRLLVRSPSGSGLDPISRLGGLPLAPVGTEWPTCETCGNPLVFLAQFRLADSKVKKLDDGLLCGKLERPTEDD